MELGNKHKASRRSIGVRRTLTTSHSVQWELVKQGAAIIGMLESIGDAEPLVERINVPELKLIESELWIVTHKELRTSIRVRKVFDFLVAEFVDS